MATESEISCETEFMKVSLGEEDKDDDEINEALVSILKEASTKAVDRAELSGLGLRFLPEAFGKLRCLVLLNLSNNHLEVLPDSVAGLEKLEELDVSSNLLSSLPDSIGLLKSLKVLNVSNNKLNALPESIALCKSLEELYVGFNNLMFLPTNLGYGLVNLKVFSVPLNEIRSLPTSICEMTSLRHLDAHFNKLHGLPLAIGRLTNLETLNLSSNFYNFTDLPDTFGDMANLRELDLSNNQIRALPYSFFCLENLTKLTLDQNPLVIPPLEVVGQGVEAVKDFMKKRQHSLLAAEEEKGLAEANGQVKTPWLAWGASMLNNIVSGVSENAAAFLGDGKSGRDSYLDQQL